jgi:hypothetical protein
MLGTKQFLPFQRRPIIGNEEVSKKMAASAFRFQKTSGSAMTVHYVRLRTVIEIMLCGHNYVATSHADSVLCC